MFLDNICNESAGLIISRSYKELMADCNRLGMGENRSLRKLEKAVEKIKRLKTRVEELERILEEKENAAVRSLLKSKRTQVKEVDLATKSNALRTFVEDFESKETFNKVTTGHQNSVEQKKEIDLSAQGNADSSYVQPAQRLADLRLNTSSDNIGISISVEDKFHGTDWNFTGADEGPLNAQNIASHLLNSKFVTPGKKMECRFSNGSLEQMPRPRFESSGPKYIDQCSMPSSKIGTGVPHDVENSYSAFCNSNVVGDCITDEPITQTSRQETAEQDTELMIVDETSFLPIKREAGRVHLGSSFTNEQPQLGGSMGSIGVNGGAGKWCRQVKNSLSSSGQVKKAPSSGTFIAVGADGRGGQIKVLKTPRESLDSGFNSLWSRQPKRCKTQGVKHTANPQGALQIEHFFQKARQD
eukprot:Gb_07219 [translate_table: standard]